MKNNLNLHKCKKLNVTDKEHIIKLENDLKLLTEKNSKTEEKNKELEYELKLLIEKLVFPL